MHLEDAPLTDPGGKKKHMCPRRGGRHPAPWPWRWKDAKAGKKTALEIGEGTLVGRHVTLILSHALAKVGEVGIV